MCEQAARYCRDGVHKLLNKEQGKLRAQDSREQPQPVAGQDSESATAAQSGNSGAQPGGGIDGLVRWIVTKMSDNKNISSREYASSKEEVAVAQEQFFAPEPRRGISVILDVSCWFSGRGEEGGGREVPPAWARNTGRLEEVERCARNRCSAHVLRTHAGPIWRAGAELGADTEEVLRARPQPRLSKPAGWRLLASFPTRCSNSDLCFTLTLKYSKVKVIISGTLPRSSFSHQNTLEGCKET